MTSAAVDTGRWANCYWPRRRATSRLFCLAHAGGAASFFRDWGAELPEDVEVWAVQYPGRENRMAEPCIEDMHALVGAILRGIEPMLDERPVSLFGHSMGASVAHELTRRLEARHPGSVRRLFVSSRKAPRHQRALATSVHLLDDEGVVAELEALGGTSPGLLADRELRSLLLPMIRSDYRLIETYEADGGPPVDAGVVALAGVDDASMDVAHAAGWAEATSGDFGMQVFAGGHFYLVPGRSAVLARVAAYMS